MTFRRDVVRLVLGLLLVTGGAARSAPPTRSDDVLEFLRISVELEKRGAIEDLEELDRSSGRLTRAAADLATATERLGRLIREGADRASVQSAEDAMLDADARVRFELERRGLLASRLADRARRAAALREEIAMRREAEKSPDDPLTGRWLFTINPGPQRGVVRLILDGALVWGDYTLDGGFRGSIRGQLIGDKLSFDRIDSERGFDARFYGKLTGAPRRLLGSWEATAIAPTVGPTAGTWSAIPSREPDDGEKQ
jgi:hypothetical protein